MALMSLIQNIAKQSYMTGLRPISNTLLCYPNLKALTVFLVLYVLLLFIIIIVITLTQHGLHCLSLNFVDP